MSPTIQGKFAAFHRHGNYRPPSSIGKDLIPGLIPAESLVLLAGAPKCGKSDLAMAMAWSIATGTPFAGREVRPSCALYMNCEMTDHEMRRLVAPHPSDQGANLYTGGLMHPLDTDEGFIGVDSFWRTDEPRPQLVVIDTLHAAVSRTSLRNPDAIRRLIARLADLCDDRFVTVLLLVHTDAFDRRVGAHVQLSAAVGRTLRLTASPHPAEEGGRALTLHASGRGLGLNERIHLASPASGVYVADAPEDRPRTISTGETVWRADPNADPILAALLDGPTDAPTLAVRTDLRPSTARKAVDRLLSTERIAVVGRDGKRLLYALASPTSSDAP